MNSEINRSLYNTFVFLCKNGTKKQQQYVNNMVSQLQGIKKNCYDPLLMFVLLNMKNHW